MSLSPHEKIEFERLTADLQFDESDMKQMAKMDKGTAGSYIAWPSLHANASVILLGFAGIATILTMVFMMARNPVMAVTFGVTGLAICFGVAMLMDEKRQRKSRKTGTNE